MMRYALGSKSFAMPITCYASDLERPCISVIFSNLDVNQPVDPSGLQCYYMMCQYFAVTCALICQHVLQFQAVQ